MKNSLLEHVHWIKANEKGVIAVHGELKSLQKNQKVNVVEENEDI